MFRNIALSVCLMGGCIWSLAMASNTNTAQLAASDKTFKPVASVHVLMHGKGLYFKQIRTGLKEAAGKKRNESLHEAGEMLAELANVNQFNSAKDDYRAWAKQLSTVAMEFATEAKKSDADDAKLNALVKKMGGACGACHDAYQ